MRYSNVQFTLLVVTTGCLLPTQSDAGSGILNALSAMASADSRADQLVSEMTLEEKIDYIGGTNWFYIRSLPRLEIPKIKLSDGPMAVRVDVPAIVPTTAFPGGIALAATWDPELARRIGVALGRDCRSRGVHILLAPAVNIYRSPLCGRNFEYMGEDPFLASAIAVPMIQGIQSQNVIATIKHFACNNMEWDRHNMSSEVDERTLHEIYLPVFKAAVQQGKVGCLMTAYNLLNGSHCAENEYLIDQVLKNDWGFKGIIMSDWDSTYDPVNTANHGVDLEMPKARSMTRSNILAAIKSGAVKESVLDEKVRRILRTVIAAGFFDKPQERTDIPRNDPESARVALEGARESIVLLKNEKKTLPLDRTAIKSIAIVGPNAHPLIYGGGGSSLPRVFSSVSTRDGISNIVGADIKILLGTNEQQAVDAAKQADVAVVCVGFNPGLETETRDRTFELPRGQTNLIQAVAAINKRTIVVINSGGGVAWAGWLDKVPAVVQAWYSGQSSGQAVAEILFGNVNPSGKLPATFEKKWEDNPSAPYYHVKENKKLPGTDTVYMATPYTEGIFVGYRGYDEKKIEPQFAFGHGLSYTDFSYSRVQMTPKKIPADGKVAVTVEVKNTGKRAGDEIVQLYVHDAKSSVPQPVKALKGFQRVSLQPGEKKTVTLALDASQLAFYDVKTHGWVVEPGAFDVMVGSSSRDIRGKAGLEVTAK